MNALVHILMILTSTAAIDATHPTGVWFEEYAVPYSLFSAAGYEITVVSTQGGNVPIDPRSAPTDEQRAEFFAALEQLQNTKPLRKIDPQQFAAVFIPGGHGTMFDLPQDEHVSAALAAFAEASKPIAAVCHGPAAFVNVKLKDGTPLVKGRRLTAFTNAEERETTLEPLMPFLLETRLRELGAEFAPAANWADHVIVDGNLITGQNPASSASAAKALIAALTPPETK